MVKIFSIALLFCISTSVNAITITQAFVGYVNEHRESLGLKPLILNSQMTSIAKTHSTNMATYKVAFGHSGFSSRCSQARQALGGGNLCAENVAAGQTSGRTVFNSWMNSSTHRSNIESSRLTHMGFAYTKSVTGKFYWTNLFLER